MSDQGAGQTNASSTTGAGQASAATAPTAPVTWKIEKVTTNPDGTLAVVLVQTATIALAPDDWSSADAKGHKKPKAKTDITAAITRALKSEATAA